MSVAKSAGLFADPVEKSAFFESLRASAGTLPGIFAWGLVTGMAMLKSGLTIWQSLGMTFTVFAGSAQLAALPLIAANVPLSVVFFTAMVVNLRFVIFAAAIGPHFTHLPWYKKIWYGYLNGDLMMAFFPQRFPHDTVGNPAGKEGYYSGVIYPNWVTWQGGLILGLLLAGQIPDSWGIGFAGTLALLAILVPMTVNRAALAGVVTSGAIAVLAHGLPYRLGLLLGVMLGMLAAMVVDSALEENQAGDIDE